MALPDFPITTERLVLRPFEPGDGPALGAIYGSEENCRYLYCEPFDEVGTITALAKRLALPAFDGDDQVLNLAAVLRETDEVVADLLFFYRRHAHRQGEIGYVLQPAAHGKGLATEGMAAMVRVGFESAGVHRIEARCDARNTASIRVMAKLGMRQEAHLRENEFVKGEWTDEIVYALLAEEWRAGQSRPDPA